MNSQKEKKQELSESVQNTLLSELGAPGKVVDFVEKLFAVHDRTSLLARAIPGQQKPSFEDLKEHVANGKFDLNSADLVGSERQLLETATLFPHDIRFQAFRDGSGLGSMTPKEVSLNGVLDGLEYAKLDRERKIHLRGVDLSFMDFSNYCFYECDLSETNLENALFHGADLENANLAFANLTEADFTGADLRGANLTGATVTEAVFIGAKLDKETADYIVRSGGVLKEKLKLNS